MGGRAGAVDDTEDGSRVCFVVKEDRSTPKEVDAAEEGDEGLESEVLCVLSGILPPRVRLGGDPPDRSDASIRGDRRRYDDKEEDDEEVEEVTPLLPAVLDWLVVAAEAAATAAATVGGGDGEGDGAAATAGVAAGMMISP